MPMAFKTMLATRFIKPYPSSRSSTTLFARFASYRHPPSLIVARSITSSDSDSDSDDSETPIPKGCPLMNPFLARGRVFPYVMKDTEHSFVAKVDLPGVSKEDLRVWVENHHLHIKAEEEEDGDNEEAVSDEDIDDEDDGQRKYIGSIPIPKGGYKMDRLKAQMRNGVLKLVIPKLKLEERKDITIVPVNN
ncbi:26.2 kDa heat shock protein, mitochondrial-like [Cornus florida]|uniref:26.2 kDa heat shock protein, mitochondrial-like n=1 Tax=Cornus florida TaxID=4283 RepID=UPI002899F8A8|nr:26.2 kDa heat shock protein, mitochondrial-like [Cornus florida]